jgi:hypothetical protein
MRLSRKTLAALCAARVALQPKLEWEASNQALMFPIFFVELIKTSSAEADGQRRPAFQKQ